MLFVLLCLALTELVQTQPKRFKRGPENATLTWQNDTLIIIQTLDIQHEMNWQKDCFLLVLQWKSQEEMEWQRNIISKEPKADSSKLDWYFFNPNLDSEKCFHIRLQFRVSETCYSQKSESEWSNNIFMKNYSLVDSCDGQKLTEFAVQTFIVQFSAISILIIFFIVFLRCYMERMKKCIFPIVPDPKNSFNNLYDSHNGYFQEWEKTSANDAHHEVIECVMEEQNYELESTYVKESEVVMPVSQPLIEEQKDCVTPGSLQKEASNVWFGNMNITANESMYVML
ncbi:cytokine receptor-like factor 2 [Eleutherodactylus coqui]|uniref:cytokine receptor-like factor 2 n=1 Tax=Eleutherodactylus coqui TaxID=57060 RepID=UPI00346312A6